MGSCRNESFRGFPSTPPPPPPPNSLDPNWANAGFDTPQANPVIEHHKTQLPAPFFIRQPRKLLLPYKHQRFAGRTGHPAPASTSRPAQQHPLRKGDARPTSGGAEARPGAAHPFPPHTPTPGGGGVPAGQAETKGPATRGPPPPVPAHPCRR